MPMNSGLFGPLVTVSQLVDLMRAGCLVVDCRFQLSDTEAGRRVWRDGHIPGAVYAHLDDDLSSPVTPSSGRHPLPHPHDFATFLASLGWTPGIPLVAYDADNGAMAAARLWWLMHWLGQPQVAVLDGGLEAWTDAGYPLEYGEVAREPAEPAVLTPNDQLTIDADALAAALKAGEARLLDARGPERFSGEVEPLDRKAGHVPGAGNLPFTGNVDDEGRFLDADALRQRLVDAFEGFNAERVVHMCGSGVTAAHNLLAAAAAGLPMGRLYPGSWSEWIRDPGRPIATGEHHA